MGDGFWDPAYENKLGASKGATGEAAGGGAGKAGSSTWGAFKGAGGMAADPWGTLQGMGKSLGIPGLGGLGPATAKPLSPGFDWSGNMQQSRGQMQAAMDPVQAWALSGQGPSAAQAQLQAGKDQAVASASSQAKSAYGLTPGQQATLATNAGTQATQQAANQAAQLRAMEQQQAMQNYLGMLAAQRQADIDVYKTYSDQYAQTNMANAQAKNGFVGGLMQTGGTLLGGLL